MAQSALLGIPAPAFNSALAFYDGYRSAVLPANLIQVSEAVLCVGGKEEATYIKFESVWLVWYER